MEGGAATGFRHVPPEEYVARLMKFSKDKSGHIVVRQVRLWHSLSIDSPL